MKRTTITMDEYGRVAVPSDAASVWMSEMELVELFNVIVPTLRATVRSVYKNGRCTCLPYQHTQCRKGAQCPFGKDVLAKRQTNAVAFVKRQTAM